MNHNFQRKNAENKDTNETAIIPGGTRRPSFNLKPPPLNPPPDPFESPLEELESLLDELEEIDDPELPAAVETAVLTVPTLPPIPMVVLPIATVVPVPLDVPETRRGADGKSGRGAIRDMTLAIDTLLRDVVRDNANVNHAAITLAFLKTIAHTAAACSTAVQEETQPALGVSVWRARRVNTGVVAAKADISRFNTRQNQENSAD
ncbi:hypothetical protein B0H16DRAFT_1461938 [Mycena metata]|uniref:Uncharacterized protein n=1 Tax=Mycena metata TaxID=1033252 RepID=A0AAD7IQ64_9AGAR|nr:hypothetical protein B0H16DRAFT_1461938 [Mycena metata]